MEETLRDLIETHQASVRSVVERPPRLPLESIKELPEVFQPREGVSEQHVADLVKVIANVTDLDPVTVLVVGNAYILIDGHHRMEAYRMAKVKPRDVPVRYFDGGPLEALIEGGAENGKVRLALSPRERQDFAWRLVVSDMLTRPQIEKAAGVSRAQVTIMRKARAVLGEEASGFRSWFRARSAAGGKDDRQFSEEDIQSWKEERAARIADAMAKRFGTSLANETEVAAMALAVHFGRKLEDLVRDLGQHLPEDFEMDPSGGLF